MLLVEDDERIRTSMRLSLEDEGYEVDEAATGEEAIEAQARATASNPFDLLVVDIMLPGMDGFECCRQLRRASSVPIIMVTARTDTHDVVAGLEAGADDYVTKPFEPKELAARIRALLRRARSGEPGLVQLKRGVLRGGADQRDNAGLHHRQEPVLLRAVEAVDLVDEQQRPLPCPAALRGVIERASLRSATPENTAES